MSFLDEMDTPYPEEVAAFGEHWCYSGDYPHGEDVLVAFYPKEKGGDGQNVEVYCAAYPARFYRIVALESYNSIGEPIPAWTLGTGSSMAEEAALLAEKISEGMLALKQA
jgi:hypothetical protein